MIFFHAIGNSMKIIAGVFLSSERVIFCFSWNCTNEISLVTMNQIRVFDQRTKKQRRQDTRMKRIELIKGVDP